MAKRKTAMSTTKVQKSHAKASISARGNGANLGSEAKMWQAADKLRNNMDAAEYKRVVLGPFRRRSISCTASFASFNLICDT